MKAQQTMAIARTGFVPLQHALSVHSIPRWPCLNWLFSDKQKQTHKDRKHTPIVQAAAMARDPTLDVQGQGRLIQLDNTAHGHTVKTTQRERLTLKLMFDSGVLSG